MGTGTIDATSIVAQGKDADLTFVSDGDINLGYAAALGDIVTIEAAGEIIDANGSDTNVEAQKMFITAPSGVASLQTAVDELSADGGGGAEFITISNSKPLAITADTLATGSGVYGAISITILDMMSDVDNPIVIPAGASLTLQTSTGNIVFLNQDDAIKVTGSGSFNIFAGQEVGSEAVAIIGNLLTEGGDIYVGADSHITIGLLDADTGDVTVESRNGIILDGNGPDINVKGNVVWLIGKVPTEREEELHTMTTIADASAAASEMETKSLIKDMTEATADAYAATADTKEIYLEQVQGDLETDTEDYEDKQSYADDLQLASDITSTVSFAAGLAADIAESAAAPAQAIPLVGDGGASTVAQVLRIVATAAEAAHHVAMWLAYFAQQ
ncbi:MAG TPA: hypothetical protein PLK80_18155, partial [bacterium]|nr:hypothetical protein [bacterium]